MKNCPICEQPRVREWKSETGLSFFVLFPCGLEIGNQHANPGWKRKFGTYCNNDLDAVRALREDIVFDTANCLRVAIREGNPIVLYRMLSDACSEIDRLADKARLLGSVEE